ncbi:hypothetical protein C8R45DRAFT_990590 [Mycena sanguinolenta]|nr:hypothetical protein C8R45DRAFT_990590 [Mycena sanguinolenta]
MVRLLCVVVTQTLMTGFPDWDVMRWLCSPRLEHVRIRRMLLCRGESIPECNLPEVHRNVCGRNTNRFLNEIHFPY